MSTQLCVPTSPSILLAAEVQFTYFVVNVINGLCSFVAVVGNIVLILAILQSSSLRHNPSFVLLCNLAVSDLGVGLISQPLFIALLAVESKGDIELSRKMTIAFQSTAGCLGVLSILTITAISFDRFLAVHLGIRYRRVVTVKKVKITISLQWLIAMLSGITYVFDCSVFFFLVIIIICLCLIFTSSSYLAIAFKLNGLSAQLKTHAGEVIGTNQPKSFNIGRYKKTLKSMLYVYGAFLVCYIPYLCFAIAQQSIGFTRTVYVLYLVTGTLVLANSAINPCLYYWRITELRVAVQKLLRSRPVTIQEFSPAPRSASML